MTNEQETVELAPVWAHALATIVLKRVTTTIEDTFVPLTGREIDWPSQRRDTESLAKLIHLKAEAHYGNQHAADQATITTLRERLAAAEANWRRCYAAVVLAHDTFIFGVEINEQTPRRCEVIETTAHIVLAMAHAVPPQAETAEVEK